MVTSQEAADLLGVNLSTVSRWARLGRLQPAVKVPTATLFLRSDVEQMATALKTVREGVTPAPAGAA
jgi:excisionase family DNA binding protein